MHSKGYPNLWSAYFSSIPIEKQKNSAYSFTTVAQTLDKVKDLVYNTS